MAAIKVNVNANPIPWILIEREGVYRIQFFNDNPTHDKKVTFREDAPPGFPPDSFTVESHGEEERTLNASDENERYPYRVSNGGTRNGGIEIRLRVNEAVPDQRSKNAKE